MVAEKIIFDACECVSHVITVHSDPHVLISFSRLIFLIFTECKGEFVARGGCRSRWRGLVKTGFAQRPEAVLLLLCAARFHQFSLSAVGVVALAPSPAVQLNVNAGRLAVAGGAEEAAQRP